MSASVFKPIHPYHLDGPASRMRTVFAEKKLGRVRRALFEPIDREETQRFLKRELDLHTRNEMSKWEFDFVKGVPMNPAAASRYLWQPMRPIHNAPMKTRPEHAVEVDNSELYHRPAEHLAGPLRENVVAPVVVVVEAPLKKQSKITDYMQSRKRSADPSFSKKLTSSPKAPKISRDCS